jgi:hypothetical protein
VVNKGRRRLLLAILVIATTLSVVALEISFNPVQEGHVKATLIISFGSVKPYFMADHLVIWSKHDGNWTYSATAEANTTYEFINVSISTENVWSLMLAASSIMKETTGSGLNIQYTYYPEYQDYFITSIAGASNGNGLYWQYYVNGQMAAFGVLHEKVSQGDVVKWALEPY